MGTPKDSEKTRAKIIEAAGQLFAERGFNGVTVREIVQKAVTHLSALNYHFRTKEALYREVLLEACRDASLSPEDQEQLLRLEPREALYVLIGESIKNYQKQVASNWQTIIITRECWKPSSVFKEVVEVYFKSQTDFIADIIGKIADKPANDHQVRFAVIVMIGVLDTFGLYGHLIDAIAPGLTDQLNKRNLHVKQLFLLVTQVAKTSIEE